MNQVQTLASNHTFVNINYKQSLFDWRQDFFTRQAVILQWVEEMDQALSPKFAKQT